MRHAFLVVLALGVSVSYAQRGQGDGPPGPRPPGPQGAPRFDHPILRLAESARGSLRYSGLRTVEIRERDGAKTFTQRVLRQGPRIRIEYPPDSPYAGHIIVEDGFRRLYYLPSSNEIRESPRREDEIFGGFVRDSMHRRDKQIRLEARPGGRIAGQETDLLEFVEGPDKRVMMRLWIDKRRGAILKREVFDPKGGRVGFFEFTRLRYDVPIPPEAFVISRPGAVMVTPEVEFQRAFAGTGIKPARLAPQTGFRLVGVRKFEVEGSTAVIQFYSKDGRRLSLHQVTGTVDMEKLRRFGGDRVQVHSWKKGNVTLVLVGGMPLEDLKKIAESVRD